MKAMAKYSNLLIILTTFFFLFACANPGIPSGGEKDITPPVVTRTQPNNYTTNFDKKYITISFDEFVKLENAAQNVVISPPQKKKPRIRLRERAIEIEIRDSLRPETTYTIDFGEAIKDNNEGNPLGEYSYVFTTGEVIDSLGVAGFVRKSASDSIAEGTTVALYNPSDTLNPFLLLPNYIAKTDSLGFFMFTNIRNQEYTILAFDDKNNNSALDPEEPMGFLNQTIHPERPLENAPDDTIQLNRYTRFQNVSIHLRTFQPKITNQYLTEYKRPIRNKLEFTFNAPYQDSLQIDIVNTENEPDFIIEKDKEQTKFSYWIANKEVASQDSLLVAMNYLRTDSLGNLSPYPDTLRLNFREPKKKKIRRREKEEEKETITFLNIQSNITNEVHFFKNITFSFDTPMKSFTSQDVFLYTLQDSIEVAKDFEIQPDSIAKDRIFHLITSFEPDSTYHIRIDSATIYDIDDKFNDKFLKKLKTYRESYYGKLFVSLSGKGENIIVQVFDKQKPNEIVKQKEWNGEDKIVFDLLPPSTYILKAIWDSNGNGQWDNGDYETQQQPERVQFFQKDIKLPSNWELEVSWILKKEE